MVKKLKSKLKNADNQEIIWNNSFKIGQGLNRYPYAELPSCIFNLYGKNTNKSKITVLEVGSGAGANIWFFAREGFDTYGIDFSKFACKNAKKMLKKDKLKAHIAVGDFCNLPYKNNFFDLVLDRNSLYCLAKKDLLVTCKEIKRVLKKGGRFLSFMYPTDNGCIKYGKPKKIEKNTYTDFKNSTFKRLGITHFVTENEVKKELYDGFKIEYIKKIKYDFIYPKKINEITLFAISGIKK